MQIWKQKKIGYIKCNSTCFYWHTFLIDKILECVDLNMYYFGHFSSELFFSMNNQHIFDGILSFVIFYSPNTYFLYIYLLLTIVIIFFDKYAFIIKIFFVLTMTFVIYILYFDNRNKWYIYIKKYIFLLIKILLFLLLKINYFYRNKVRIKTKWNSMIIKTKWK